MSFRWSLNPYTGCVHRCTFCFVRAFERRADRAWDEGYGQTIRVKRDIVHQLERELGSARWKRELVVIGTATDPYQPAEGRYRLTRACIGVFARHRTPLHLITRGPMIVRDLDVLADAARSGGASVTVSIPTVDERVWRATEPGTASPRQRHRAVKALVDAGIETEVALAPILPRISDSPASIQSAVAAARESGAVRVWPSVLYLKPGTREHFLECLARDFPQQVGEYERLYCSGAHAPRGYVDAVRACVADIVQGQQIADRRHAPVAPPTQLSLFQRLDA